MLDRRPRLTRFVPAPLAAGLPPSRIAPTERQPGGACLRGARLEQDLQSLVREVQTQAGEMRGTLRLFANSSAVVGLLPERLNTFRDKYPLVEIALQEVISEEVIRACLDERADIGVGVGINVPTGIESWHLANDPLSVVLPPGHELGKRRSVRAFIALIMIALIARATRACAFASAGARAARTGGRRQNWPDSPLRTRIFRCRPLRTRFHLTHEPVVIGSLKISRGTHRTVPVE